MIKLAAFAFLLFVIYTMATRAMAGKRPMARGDAARLLGIAADADAETVIDAHRRLIAKVHPDTGGSAELAAQINQARETMLKP